MAAEIPVLDINDVAPNFTANSQFGQISFHSYIDGAWALFFSHPADYTPVCTTEVGMLAKLQSEFDSRNCRIIGLSIDSGFRSLYPMMLFQFLLL